MSKASPLSQHLAALQQFWRREPFHDAPILDVSALNRRALIRLAEWTLVITGCSRLERCGTPTVWLYESVQPDPNGFELVVETEEGNLKVRGTDLRLIRNSDLSMVIPPIDPHH
ncbi:hypothetical protein [Planctomyces sp. SH-PL14]|uniref:hypothetical protein n=1 Tax=Planctomyces sp. SH-PL14 TaxID=1632864 RepID=UPI00078DA0D7|nr:hypothetical protein [Planctomyces sp. SH-PL14]AMV17185.1 hypothetical protein VT03_04790 [Planctomyces sp. SH-PL14]